MRLSKSGSLSKSFIQANSFTTKHMCLETGPECLQSACVFYPYNFHLVRICRITSVQNRGTSRRKKRSLVLGAQPSHAPTFIQVPHLLTWTRYIPRCWKAYMKSRTCFKLHLSILILCWSSFWLFVCGPISSDLLSQSLNLLYRPLAWITNAVSSDIAWIIQSLKVFHCPCLRSHSPKPPSIWL